MAINDILKGLNERFGSRILKVQIKNPRRAYVDIYPKDVAGLTRYLFKELGFRFNIASGVDDCDGMEILYHFTSDRLGIVISVRSIISDRSAPHVDTITTVTRSAWWIEREIHEMFGIVFDGNSDLRTLLLPDDWPKGVYPLRKDFIAAKRDSRASTHKPENKGSVS